MHQWIPKPPSRPHVFDDCQVLRGFLLRLRRCCKRVFGSARCVIGGSLKETKDETLFLELALWGYDLSALRDNETSAEIIKIGAS